MASPLDFNAVLGAQLRDAAQQMRSMRTPPKKHEDTSETAIETGTETVTETASELTGTTGQGVEHTVIPTVTVDELAQECTEDDKESFSSDFISENVDKTVCYDAQTEDAEKEKEVKKQEHKPPTVTQTVINDVLPTVEQHVTQESIRAPENPASQAQGKPTFEEVISPASTHKTAHSIPPHEHSTLLSPSANGKPQGGIHDDDLAPLLSEKSWTGGVRGAVLDALRQLAGGKDHVQVNLKRLAAHADLPYGSVRNAMSRLVRSGDIISRQIRVADGHGVRVEFLTAQGKEGTAPDLRRDHHKDIRTLRTLVRPEAHGFSAHRDSLSADSAMFSTTESCAVNYTANSTDGMTAGEAVTKNEHFLHPFWSTSDNLFAMAWPNAAGAGLNMHRLAPLAAVFMVQGFDPSVMPRLLRYVDWQLEHMQTQTHDEKNELCALFIQSLQRRGHWPKPEGYEE